MEVGNKFQEVADRLARSSTANEATGDVAKFEDKRCKIRVWHDYIHARGKRYEKCRLSNFHIGGSSERSSAVSRITDYCDHMDDHFERGEGMILVGPSGTGKDHLLTGAVFRAVNAGVKSIRWVSGPLLFAEVRGVISENRHVESMIRQYKNCGLLVFSDLAMGTLTDFQADIVYRIVDARYSSLRPTWVSVNAPTRDALEDMTSVQIVDRLSHGAVKIMCNWESYRK